jgi:hypothetical protein
MGDAMSGDLPMISLPTDSTKVDAVPPARPAAPAKPTTELRRPAVAAPALAAKPADPRNASELRRAAPPPAAPRPAVEARKPVEEPALEEDPEKLLREYADRQKTKITRLEAQLVELKKLASERDQFRAKSEALARELESAKRQLEAASKQDAVIKDLQAKVDASILAHSMLSDENNKVKAKAQELASLARKLEEKANAAEKGLADATKSLAAQTEGRKEAEARIAGALQALQGEAPRKPVAPAPAPVRR